MTEAQTNSKLALQRAALSAAIAAVFFVGGMLVAGEFKLVRTTVTALILGALMGFTSYRMQLGKHALPVAAAVLLAVGAMAIYTRMILADMPSGVEWLEIAFIFVFPIGLLVMAYRWWRQDRRRRTRPD